MYAAALAKYGTNDEPTVLPKGTEVSAKYKGAFCEARVKHVDRHVRVKIVLPDNSCTTMNEESILNQPKGVVVGAEIELRWNGNRAKAVIQKVMDHSHYTVVFDDGDETTLKRSSLCLKSGKHYSESESLDKQPLTNPEHIMFDSTTGRRSRRPRSGNSRNANSPSTSTRKLAKPNQSQSDSDDDDSNSSCAKLRNPANEILKDLKIVIPEIGKVVCVEYSDKRTSKNKEAWFPAWIVEIYNDPKDVPKDAGFKASKGVHLKVRSFCDDRFYIVSRRDARTFEKEVLKKNYSYKWSYELRRAVDRALSYSVDDKNKSDDDSDDLEYSDSDIESNEFENEEDAQERQRRQQKQNDERDMFVAKLYKFMDERGTPINSCPQVNGIDLNLYKLYRIVHKMGGPNKVTNRNAWKKIYNILGLNNDDYDDDMFDDSNLEAILEVKSIYENFLHPFHELNRKLGPAPALVDSRSARSMSRPSRGERKREVERSRLNSVSSIASSKSTRPPKTLPSSATPKSEKDCGNKNKIIENSDNESNQPSASPGPSTSTGIKQSTEQTLPSASKSEDKKRKKKDAEIDSGRLEKQIKEEPENDDSQTTGSSSFVDGDTDNEDNDEKAKIQIGDGISVLYGRGKQSKMYDAKVMKMRMTQTETEYFVHYYGWSTRYDEWIKKDRITKVLRDKSLRRRSGKTKNKGEPLVTEESGEDDTVPQRSRKTSIKSEPVKEVESQKRPRSLDSSRAESSTSKTRVNNTNERNDNDKRCRSNSIKEEPKELRPLTSKTKATVEIDPPRPQRVRTSSYSQKDYSSRKEKVSVKVEEKERSRREERDCRKTKHSSASDASVSSSVKTRPTKTLKKSEAHSSNSNEPEEESSRAKREKKKESERSTEVSGKKEKSTRDTNALKRNLDAELSKAASSQPEPCNAAIGNKNKRSDEPLVKQLPLPDFTDIHKPSTSSDTANQTIDEVEEENVKLQLSTNQEANVKSCTILDFASKNEEERPCQLSESKEPKPTTPEVENEVKEDKEDELKKTEEKIDEVVPPASPPNVSEDLPLSDDNHTESEDPPHECSLTKSAELEQASSNLSASNSSLPVGEEDLEVQSILCKEEEIGLGSSESNDYNLASKSPEVTNHVIGASGDCNSDRESPGPLVMADEEEDNGDKVEELQTEPEKSPVILDTDVAIMVETSKADSKILEPEEEKSKESEPVDSLLLCQETVPASPPPSPPSFPFTHQNACPLRESAEHFNYLASADQYSTMSISSQPSCLVHRSSPMAIDSNDDDDDDDDDDDLEDGAAGVEADVDEGEDEVNNDRPMTRKAKAKSTERKRRNLRTTSKANASNAQSVSALLSSQDSSQDGDYPSVSDKHHKTTDKVANKRSIPSETKNDEDSSSESHNRGNAEKASSPSPKKRRRQGRMRTTSQSETPVTSVQNNSFTKESRSNIGKTRGRSRNNSGHSQTEHISFHTETSTISDSYFSRITFETASPIPSNLLATYTAPEPKYVDYTAMVSFKPKSKYNFVTPLDPSLNCEEKCQILMERLLEMRRIYNETKKKRTALERKKKKFARKNKEMEKKLNEKRPTGDLQPSKVGLSHSGSDSSSSSSKNERISRSRLAALSRVARNEHELQNDERLAAAALGDLGGR